MLKIDRAGFTLIELLVVIAIIGVLSSIVMSSFSASGNKAKAANAKVELMNIMTAMNLLYNDTGKISNGCPIGVVDSPETYLDSPWAGLISVPQVGHDTTFSPSAGGCGWAAQNIALWKGPYILDAIDPWGRPYVFDPDYFDGVTTKPVIFSLGPTGVVNSASASDIIIKFP